MNTDNWHNVLTIFTMVILVDDRVYKEEVDKFVASVKELNDKISPDMLMTEGMAFDWFVANRGDVQKMMSGKDADRNIKDTILRLKNLPEKTEILQVMKDIAYSDANYHDNEKCLVRRAAYAWGIPSLG